MERTKAIWIAEWCRGRGVSPTLGWVAGTAQYLIEHKDAYDEDRLHIDTWIFNNYYKSSKRLKNCLTRQLYVADVLTPYFTYIDEVTKQKFMGIRGNGITAWNEFKNISAERRA